MKLGFIALIILLGIGGYYGYQYYQEKKQQEEARVKTEEEAKQKAEEEARTKDEGEEARAKDEEEEARAKDEEEEARAKTEEEARAKTEEEARTKAGEEARLKEEEARLKEEKLKAKAKEARLKEEKLKARQAAWKRAETMTVDEKLQIIHEIVEDRWDDFVVWFFVVSGAGLSGEQFTHIYNKEPESEWEKGKLEELQKAHDNFLDLLQKDPKKMTETEKGRIVDYERACKNVVSEVRIIFTKDVKDRSRFEKDMVERLETNYKKMIADALDDVYEKMPLDIDRSKKLSPEFLQQTKERAQMEYSIPDETLKERYAAEAEEKFPVYHVGEVVTVYHAIYGGSFDKATGKLVRVEPKFVWIDDKKIARAKLREDIAPRFDQNQIEQLKKKYVEQGIVRYHQDRSAFESKMNEEELRRIRGFVKYDGKWQSARNVVKQMFEAILKKPPQPRRKKKETPPLRKDAVFSTGPASQMENGANRGGFRSIYR